ncbi:Hypothetical predicted protein [Podarcis lilfordi]|uniref:DUF4219 domain-containing protein n=1 Tax=Podarcis lilfordi TaxID=74358 RepID=A0AA35JYE6_9SAUR|nr:Hypothetical predicted protein [Podarcis lilfordi]
MADGQESYSVPFEKLNGSNWEEWSRKLKAWLVAKGLWEATQGPPQQAPAGAAAAVVAAAHASQRKDQKALGAIVLSLEGSQLPLVEGLETAQEVYQALERVHHRTTAGAKIHTTGSLFELKLRPGDSIRQHVTKMLSVFNKLRLFASQLYGGIESLYFAQLSGQKLGQFVSNFGIDEYSGSYAPVCDWSFV